MDLMRGLEVFITIAEMGGMAPAARALNMSTSAVSRHLKELENWTGEQFFRRTTRSLSLTEAGAAKLIEARETLAAIQRFQQHTAIAEFRHLSGTIKMTAPEFVLKRMMLDVLAKFQKEHPALNLEILAADRFIDLVSEGYDLGIRVGKLADSTLKARKLCNIGLELVASPAYLKKHGEPERASDLKDHHCLLDTAPDYKTYWPVTDDSAKRSVKVSGTVRINSGEIIEQYAVNGRGIALLPDPFVSDHVKAGKLVSVLPDAKKPAFGMYIVHPDMRIMQPKVRAFVDFIVGQFGR